MFGWGFVVFLGVFIYMNWRNPYEELPEPDQVVWIMLEPHKNRGTLLESAPSIEIVCGWAEHNGSDCRVSNGDELGMGSISWYLKTNQSDRYKHDYHAIAWMPVDEMVFPGWGK